MEDKIEKEDQNKISKDLFHDIFISYYDGLCRFSELLVNDSVGAEDCVQAVFLNIWERKEHLKIKTKIKSYLYRSVYNQSLNLLKRKQVEKKYVEILKLIPPDENQMVLADIEARELEALLQKKLNELSPKVREVFELSRFSGLKNKEIADKLNIPIKTVEGRMTKALFFLRSSLLQNS